jgi:DhnA family fructose-bisphosphate aldolase class Ia
VAVDVNHSSTGVVTEKRPVVWNAIDPKSYGNDGPGVFKVEGTIEGTVEKAVATVTVEYRNRIADLKETVAGLEIVYGNKNALMVKLNQAEKLLSDTRHDKSAQAVESLNAFAVQVNNFVKPGKLTEEQANEMTQAAKETIRNIRN